MTKSMGEAKARKFQSDLRTAHFETSAMTGENIDSTFNFFINQVVIKKLALVDPAYLAKIKAENIPY